MGFAPSSESGSDDSGIFATCGLRWALVLSNDVGCRIAQVCGCVNRGVQGERPSGIWRQVGAVSFGAAVMRAIPQGGIPGVPVLFTPQAANRVLYLALEAGD